MRAAFFGTAKPGGISPLAPEDVTSATLLADWEADSITIRTAMRESVSAPNITLTESIAGSLQIVQAIQIVITGTGTLDAATYEWFLDGVSQGTGIVSATVALTGTGLVANCAAGTYDSGVVYDTTAHLRAKTGGVDLVEIAGSGDITPTIVSVDAQFQRPILRFSTSQRLGATDAALATAIAGGVDPDCEVHWVGRVDSVSATRCIWSLGNDTDGDFPCLQLRVVTSPSVRWEVRTIADNGTTIIRGSTLTAVVGRYYFRTKIAGGQLTLEANGVDIIGGSSGVDGSFALGLQRTLNRLSANAFYASGTNVFAIADTDLAKLWCFDGPLSVDEANAHRQWVNERFFA